MNKKMVGKILINNFLFAFFEFLFLALIMSGTFDFFAPSSGGVLIPFEGLSVVIVGTVIVMAISFIIAYLRYDFTSTDILILIKYYSFSFIFLVPILSYVISFWYPLVVVISTITILLTLLSLFISILTRQLLSKKRVFTKK